MNGVSRAAVVAATLTCIAATGCAKHEQTQTTTVVVQRSLANPSDFPLYPRSAVMTVVPVDSAQLFAAMRKADPTAEVPPKNYRGHEVIAQTTASMAQLSAWLTALRMTPPLGMHLSSTHVDISHDNRSQSQGVDGEEFDSSAAPHSVYVFVADPKLIRAEMGFAFDLIDSYSKVPGMMRGPIDDQAKQQLGYSITELLDPKSPVGAVVTAVKQLQGTGRRAILLIDESAK
jgi:hypothetical protein